MPADQRSSSPRGSPTTRPSRAPRHGSKVAGGSGRRRPRRAGRLLGPPPLRRSGRRDASLLDSDHAAPRADATSAVRSWRRCRRRSPRRGVRDRARDARRVHRVEEEREPPPLVVRGTTSENRGAGVVIPGKCRPRPAGGKGGPRIASLTSPTGRSARPPRRPEFRAPRETTSDARRRGPGSRPRRRARRDRDLVDVGDRHLDADEHEHDREPAFR